jgi:phenylpropionate dioxygenase-like ring-hydroxylating dioxygenase large terminal subunit
MWRPAAWSSEVGPRPRRAGDAVIWRDGSGLHALTDRCPHRGYPLSQGRLRGAELECAYHGWRFAPDGACVAIPGLASAPRPAHAARRLAARDHLGLAWVGDGPDGELPQVESEAGPGALRLRWEMPVRARLDDVAENILDVPHTAFLHGGWFRASGERPPVRVEARRTRDRVEARYVGEPVPRGLLGALLAPGQDAVVEHVDRFVLPCVAQVEYAIPGRMRLLATSVLREDGDVTRAWHSVSLATSRRAVSLAWPLFGLAAWWVLRQDARALAVQSRNMAELPGTSVSTELDVLGPHVRAMRERASRGEPPLPDAEWSATVGGNNNI